MANNNGEPILEKQSSSPSAVVSNGPLPTGAFLVSPETKEFLERAGDGTLGTPTVVSNTVTDKFFVSHDDASRSSDEKPPHPSQGPDTTTETFYSDKKVTVISKTEDDTLITTASFLNENCDNKSNGRAEEEGLHDKVDGKGNVVLGSEHAEEKSCGAIQDEGQPEEGMKSNVMGEGMDELTSECPSSVFPHASETENVVADENESDENDEYFDSVTSPTGKTSSVPISDMIDGNGENELTNLLPSVSTNPSSGVHFTIDNVTTGETSTDELNKSKSDSFDQIDVPIESSPEELDNVDGRVEDNILEIADSKDESKQNNEMGDGNSSCDLISDGTEVDESKENMLSAIGETAVKSEATDIEILETFKENEREFQESLNEDAQRKQITLEHEKGCNVDQSEIITDKGEDNISKDPDSLEDKNSKGCEKMVEQIDKTETDGDLEKVVEGEEVIASPVRKVSSCTENDEKTSKDKELVSTQETHSETIERAQADYPVKDDFKRHREFSDRTISVGGESQCSEGALIDDYDLDDINDILSGQPDTPSNTPVSDVPPTYEGKSEATEDIVKSSESVDLKQTNVLDESTEKVGDKHDESTVSVEAMSETVGQILTGAEGGDIDSQQPEDLEETIEKKMKEKSKKKSKRFKLLKKVFK